VETSEEETGDPHTMNEIDDDILRAWLLHRLVDEQVAAALEQRVLADDAFGARLRGIETDLIDDYARQRLGAEDRDAVARWLLATPQDRSRLRTAVALRKAIEARAPAPAQVTAPVSPHERRRTRAWRSDSSLFGRRRGALLAFAAAAVVLLVALAYWQRGSRLTPPVGPLAANASTITLLASLQRGTPDAPDAVVTVPAAASALRLQIEVVDGDASTRYTLQIANATRRVFEVQGLTARTNGPYRFVEVALAPTILGNGDYRVRVAVDGAAQPLQEWMLHTQRE
jgi:hypothetical protein